MKCQGNSDTDRGLINPLSTIARRDNIAMCLSVLELGLVITHFFRLHSTMPPATILYRIRLPPSDRLTELTLKSKGGYFLSLAS